MYRRFKWGKKISLKNLENWLNKKKSDENKKLKNKSEENENNMEKNYL